MTCADQGDNLEEVTDEGPRVSQNVFRVTCGTLIGMLHKHRFASGIRVYICLYFYLWAGLPFLISQSVCLFVCWH